jgi:hypothetical protein
MVVATISLDGDYWEEFELEEADITFLYEHLLEHETPLTPEEITPLLVDERIRREQESFEEKRLDGNEVYMPKDDYEVGQGLVFPSLDWKKGEVVDVRSGNNPEIGEFKVINVDFEEGGKREFASGIEDHLLNEPFETVLSDTMLADEVLENSGDLIEQRITEGLSEHEEFVRIAGRWFPRALLVDVNIGHLNLAEAVLDMNGGGPLSTEEIIDGVELTSDVNPKLIEFSMDLALQEDERFDEVGPAGIVSWFLKAMEPEEVQETPLYLRYIPMEYDRSTLTDEMLTLEQFLDDELSVIQPSEPEDATRAEVRLIFPHWRAGTLPLTGRVEPLFPTAYEAPRIRFTLVDGDTGERFPGWVVRKKRYVHGLRAWYEKKGLIPGGIVTVMAGKEPGEVIVKAEKARTTKNWMRTVLVGSDGGVVFATLKQIVSAAYNERMAIVVPDVEPVDEVWHQNIDNPPPFERIVVDMVRELEKLNPQGHVHVTELYAAVNMVRRCPPGPLMSLLETRPWFIHVGDLHFRFDDSESM